MVIYPALLIGAVALGIPLCRRKNGRIVYCAVMGTALFAVAAVRQSVGYDYNSYGQMYLDFMSMPLEEVCQSRIEKGFALILKMLADYINDYQSLFVLTSLFFAAAISLYIYKNCEKPYIGYFCFLTFGIYFNTLNFLRQMIAAFIVLLAMKYIGRGQFLRALVAVLLASCFHYSALIMIPFLLLLRVRMTPLTLGIYTAAAVPLFIFSWDILDIVTRYIYKGYDPHSSVHVTTGVNPIYLIFFAVLFAAAFLLRKRVNSDGKADILLNCMFFMLFFELMGVKHSILSRFALFFIIPAAVGLMPRLPAAISELCTEKVRGGEKRARVVNAIAVSAAALVCVAMFVCMIVFNYNGVMPYRTVWEVE